MNGLNNLKYGLSISVEWSIRQYWICMAASKCLVLQWCTVIAIMNLYNTNSSDYYNELVQLSLYLVEENS